MASIEYNKLEKDASFKRDYYYKSKWWLDILMVPPVCFIFTGLAGVIYLLNHEMLATLYVVPYFVLFLIGMIWLRAIKRYMFNAAIAQPHSFHVCIAKPIAEINGYVYAIFVNNSHRHEVYYIAQLAKEKTSDDISTENRSLAKKKSVSLQDETSQTDYYLRAYAKNELEKSNLSWQKDAYFQVLFVSEQLSPIVKKKDLMDVTKHGTSKAG